MFRAGDNWFDYVSENYGVSENSYLMQKSFYMKLLRDKADMDK